MLPVCLADKNIDVADVDYKPLSEVDETVWTDCKLSRICKQTLMLNWTDLDR